MQHKEYKCYPTKHTKTSHSTNATYAKNTLHILEAQHA